MDPQRSEEGELNVEKYESKRCTIFCADAANVVDEVKRHSVGLIATDPPYGVKWQSGNRGDKKFKPIVNDDGSYDAVGVVGLYVRSALMSCRHVYLFGSSHLAVKDRLSLGGSCDLIWDKGQVGMGDLTLPWGPQHEVCTFGMYVPSKANRESGYGGLSARMRQGSVLSVQRPNARAVSKHPTEKPIELMRRLIESSSITDDLVLDMFSGSGSTLVAAILAGRRAVGVEIEREYFDIAVARCKVAEQIWESSLSV